MPGPAFFNCSRRRCVKPPPSLSYDDDDARHFVFSLYSRSWAPLNPSSIVAKGRSKEEEEEGEGESEKVKKKKEKDFCHDVPPTGK